MDTAAVEDDRNPFRPICNLPEEVLIKIIDLVPMAQWASLEFVNRRLKDLAHGLWMRTREIRLDELVFNEEEMDTNPSRILNSALRKFLRRAPNIVSISGFDEFCDKRRRLQSATITLLAKFQYLESIEFKRRDQYSDRCSRVHVLSAKNMAVFLETSASRLCFKSFCATAGVDVQEEGKRLDRALAGNDHLPTMRLEAFYITPHRLEPFRFCQRFDWASLKKLVFNRDGLPVKHLISSLKHCIQIEHLELELWRNHQSSLAQIFQVLAGLENLSVLNLSVGVIYYERPPPYQNALVSLIRDLGRRGRIISFALADCDDQIVREIVAHLPFLKSLELDVSQISESAKKLLVTELKRLETLKLQTRDVSTTVKGKVIRALVANLNDLKCLYLEPWSVRNVESLAGLRKLKELDIRKEKVDGGVFDSWKRLGFGTRLEVLRLPLKDEASANAMISWIRNLSRLRVLDLSCVTSGLLRAIGDSCPMLRDLTLWRSPQITLDGVQYVIDHCPQLKVIRIFERIRRAEWFPYELEVEKYRKITFKKFKTYSE